MKNICTIILITLSLNSLAQDSHILTCSSMTDEAQWHLQLKVELGSEEVKYSLSKQEQRTEVKYSKTVTEDYTLSKKEVENIFDNPALKDSGKIFISPKSDSEILILEGQHKLNGELKDLVIMGEMVELDEDAFVNETTLTLELEGERKNIEFNCILL